jgi:Fe-S-cluster containining protein
MTCSRCGRCCKILVFNILTDHILQVKQLLKKDKIPLIVEDINDEEKFYYKLHNVDYEKIDSKHCRLTYPNKYKDKNKIVRNKRGSYKVILYCPCNKLTKNNLCSIWEDRPKVCDYDWSRSNGIDLYYPDGCTER